MQLYYNKTILSQAGIALPPTSWNDLDKQLPLLNKRDASGLGFKQNGISLGTGGLGAQASPNINRFQDIIPLLIFQSGGQLYDYQTKQVVFSSGSNKEDIATGISSGQNFKAEDNSNEALNALDFYTDFADTRSTNRYSWNTSSSNNIDQFVSGKLAYMLHYRYMTDSLKKRNSRLQFDVAPIPQLDPDNKKTFGFFFMDGMSIELSRNSAKSEKRRAAEAFLYYLSTEEVQNKLAVKTQLPGARKDVIGEQQKSDNITSIFAGGSLYADNYYKPDVVRVEKMWADLIERIQFEGLSLKESLTEANDEYQNIVSSKPKTR
jgi:ABC-type glycerol-3-phosphate transport system substrate-binding protein